MGRADWRTFGLACIYGDRPTSGQTDPRDLELCGGCNITSPCLFDVGQDDVAERRNVAGLNPATVSSMLRRLKAIEATAWTPPRTLPDNGMYCEDCKRRGGFNGPWMALEPGAVPSEEMIGKD